MDTTTTTVCPAYGTAVLVDQVVVAILIAADLGAGGGVSVRCPGCVTEIALPPDESEAPSEYAGNP